MILVNLDVVLAKRKMQSRHLAERIGLTPQNLSILKTGKARAIRLSTLNAICEVLDCQPGDILEFRPDEVSGHGEGDPENHGDPPETSAPGLQ